MASSGCLKQLLRLLAGEERPRNAFIVIKEAYRDTVTRLPRTSAQKSYFANIRRGTVAINFDCGVVWSPVTLYIEGVLVFKRYFFLIHLLRSDGKHREKFRAICI